VRPVPARPLNVGPLARLYRRTMSEMYEGIVFRSSDAAAPAAFRSLPAPFPLRLVRLANGTFGVYRVAGRSDRFDVEAMTSLAAALSESTSAALAVFYDNSCGVRATAVFRGGTLSAEFGEDDEWWVPLDDDGEPRRDVPPVPAADLDADEEYDCVRDAIEVGLATLEVPSEVTRDTLKAAFCYEKSAVLAEAG
jgi:hypothetical protein